MNRHTEMVAIVATALGEAMLQEVAFVGGCTTGLLLTDDFSKEQVRHTDDVDLIVHVVGRGGITQLHTRLSDLGFSHVMEDDAPICAMRLGELRVDFMPDDETVLGFTNRWYEQALKTAIQYQVTDELFIRLVTPAYFVATKLEAYRGRGNNDPLGSRDIEDILTLVDGRTELTSELLMAPPEIRQYISTELAELMKANQFSYAVTSAAGNDAGREDLIFERLEAIIRGAT